MSERLGFLNYTAPLVTESDSATAIADGLSSLKTLMPILVTRGTESNKNCKKKLVL